MKRSITKMPAMPINKLAELLLMEIQAARRTVYGPDLKRDELRVNGWRISEIAEKLIHQTPDESKSTPRTAEIVNDDK